MSTAIEGFGKQFVPATVPATPPPSFAPVPDAPSGLPLPIDTFTPSQAAGALTAAPTAVQEFLQNQAPPPYTLSNAMPNPDKMNSKPLYAPPLTAFQVRQFGDLLKTVRSITAAVLPNFSYSA